MRQNVNERTRMQYLEALGIDTFTPRWVLPGAQASRQCVLPAAEVPVAFANTRDEAPSPSIKDGAAQSSGALVDQLLQDVKQPAVSKRPRLAPHANAEQPHQALRKQEEQGKHEEQAAFSLAFWRVHPLVMVVDSRQPKALPVEALLQSVLSVCGVSQTLPRSEVQNWPIPGRTDKSWAAARETIQAFVEGRLLNDPVRYMVLMGDAAARAVLPEGNRPSVEDAYGAVALEALACDALLTPSLTELLMAPAKKRLLWPLLAPLRQLNNG